MDSEDCVPIARQETLLMNSQEREIMDRDSSTPLPLSSLSQGTLDRLLESIPSGTVDELSRALNDDGATPAFSEYHAQMRTEDTETRGGDIPYEIQIETRTLQVLPADCVHETYGGVNIACAQNTVCQSGHEKVQTGSRVNRVTDSEIPAQSVVKVPSISPCRPVSATMSEYPSNTPYPGPHQFEIFLTKAQETESKKTISYIYSQEENKLYVRMKVHCPVHFRVSTPPPEGSQIRAMVIYSRPQDVGDVVKRCMNHTMEDKESMDCSDHLVRCHNRSAVYEQLGPCKRHSVSFPWETPSAGSDYISGIYEFMCFSSCSGTINRRPTQLIFTLEHEQKVIGRAMIELRICACPGRDIVLSTENQVVTSAGNGAKRKMRTTSPLTMDSNSPSPHSADNSIINQFASIEPAGKRHKDDEIYNVQVRGRELYKIVMTIVKNHEFARQYEQIVNAFQAPSNEEGKSVTLPTLPVINGNHANGNGNGSIFPFEVALGKQNGHEKTDKLASNQSVAHCPEERISDWLDTLDLGHFVDSFTEHGLRSMEDLTAVINMEFLETLGLPLEDRERLYSAFIQWRSLKECSQLSSLSPYSSNSSALDSLAALGGLRFARTTIRSSIKMPRKPKLMTNSV